MRSGIKLFLILIPLTFFLGAGCPLKVVSNNASGADGGFFRSIDGGETWEQKVFVRQEEKGAVTIAALDISSFAFDPLDAQVIYAGTNQGLYKTEDGGEVWTLLGVNGMIREVVVHPILSNIVYVVQGLSVYKSSDSGESWQLAYNDSRNQEILSVTIDWYNPSRVLLTTRGREILESRDDGFSWQVMHEFDFIPKKLYIDTLDSRKMFAGFEGEVIMYSEDGGFTWERFKEEELWEYPRSQQVNHIQFYQNSSVDHVYIASNFGILMYDQKNDVLNVVPTLVQEKYAPITTFALDAVNENVIIFPVGNTLHKTFNGGASWKIIETFPSQRDIETIVSDPNLSGVFYTGTKYVEKK